MNKVNIYVDYDWLRLYSVELIGRLMNSGIFPKKVFRSHKNGHWMFFFSNNDELKKALKSLAGDDYNIIYNTDVQ